MASLGALSANKHREEGASEAMFVAEFTLMLHGPRGFRVDADHELMNPFLNHPRLLLVQKVEKADFHGKSAVVLGGEGPCWRGNVRGSTLENIEWAGAVGRSGSRLLPGLITLMVASAPTHIP